MSSNLLFQVIVVALLTAHAVVLAGVVGSTRGLGFLLGLNMVLAVAVLIYAASRAKHIWAAADWAYVGLMAFELVVLAGAIWGFKDGRLAVVFSYVAFGLHAGASIGAVVFAFGFKLTRLM